MIVPSPPAATPDKTVGCPADYTLTLETRTFNPSRRALIMGILNITADSFSDGGQFLDFSAAVTQGRAMAAAGADIIDIGGESTRPFATPVSLQEELDRVVPVIAALRRDLDTPISIDTYKAPVAREALAAGASLVNDISALRFDPDMASVVATAGVPVVLMHMQGTPQDMQVAPRYDHLLEEIKEFLQGRIAFAETAGIDRRRIIIDPGIGFGKTLDHNLEILQRLEEFQDLGCPLLLGASRKAFIGKILDLPADQRDIGSLGVIALARCRRAHIIRTHNVPWARQVLTVVEAILHGYPR